MKRFSLIGLCLTVVGLMMSGCSDFHVVKPDNLVIVQTEANPLPLTVGIRVTDQRITGGFSDMGPALASRLTNANLFKSVLFPVRLDDKVDIVIEATFAGKFVADSTLFAKAIFTGLLLWLPAPFVEYEHHYKASATIRLTSPSAQQLKTYEASSDIPVAVKILAPPKEVEDQGIKAATSDLMDQLVGEMQKDKTYLAGLKSETR